MRFRASPTAEQGGLPCRGRQTLVPRGVGGERAPRRARAAGGRTSGQGRHEKQRARQRKPRNPRRREQDLRGPRPAKRTSPPKPERPRTPEVEGFAVEAHEVGHRTQRQKQRPPARSCRGPDRETRTSSSSTSGVVGAEQIMSGRERKAAPDAGPGAAHRHAFIVPSCAFLARLCVLGTSLVRRSPRGEGARVGAAGTRPGGWLADGGARGTARVLPLARRVRRISGLDAGGK